MQELEEKNRYTVGKGEGEVWLLKYWYDSGRLKSPVHSLY